MYECCKLCGQKTKLCKSHIIPDSFYDAIKKNNKGKIVKMHTNKTTKNKVIQTGVFEYLLCEKCEEKFSKYEKYAIQIIRRLWNKDVPNDKYLGYKDVSYKTFKLFQLSILWRMIVSEQRDYKKIKFHPKHELRLRQMLLQQDAGEYYEYGCIMVLLIFNDKVYYEVIETPSLLIWEGFNGVATIFGGFEWNFIVGSHMNKFPYKEHFIQNNNDLIFRRMDYFNKVDTIRMYKKLNKQGKVKFANKVYNKKG